MFLITSLRIIYRAAMKWSENGGARLGAALAYYTLFSIAPLMLIAIHTSGAIFGEDAAQQKLHKRLEQVMGPNVAKAVEKFVETAAEPTATAWTPGVSIAILVVTALGAFLHVRNSLCMIWKLEPPHDNAWLGMLWDYTLAVIMVFIIATLMMCSLAVSLVVPFFVKFMQDAELPEEMSLQLLEMIASFFFMTTLFATVYRILSGGRIGWGYVVYGSFVAAVLFTLGKLVLGYYLAYSGTESMYGAAGSVVVFMMWVYYSSQILFFGAEMIQARRTRHEWMNAEPNPPLAA
jgi:membrane protein